ncbi:S9 family peptidase [Biformimicrobium ophioploci]|uniref:S9 family peptidase n=1 Tax=Biformimicrobium ophioploci TaxID=3036711 RepID=A0ABQ6LV43_9GAMM|nr:alpha/beta fold hydrolase [Microbulbifer sp. NKW57]GMG85934.1 S9 family peptidase [Microbulbifer sp. NKW57]
MLSLKNLAIAGLLSASLAAHATETRTLNNGNLVLEDVPAIPAALKQDLSRFQNIRSAAFRGWADEGLYISTRFGEVDQIHHVAEPGAARRQLTFFSEPVGQIATRPGHDEIAFTMDAGGSEDAQIFLLDPDSGDSRMISDGESRNGAILWSEDGKFLAYQSTRRNGASNDLWITHFGKAGTTASMALESPDGSWWGPVAFSADSRKLLVQQYISSTRSMVHLLNLESGKLQRIAGDDEIHSRNYAIGFGPGDSSIYFTSDRNGEFTRLLRHDLDNGQEQVLTGDIDWDISDFVLSRDKRRGAFITNEDGISRLYLFDPRNDRYRLVDALPMGVVGGLEFSDNGRQLALSINTPSTPTDTFVLELGGSALSGGALTRWTNSEVGGLATENFVEPQLVRYPTFDEVDGKAREIPAFVYMPRNAKGPVPVVISIHGGPEGQARPVFSSTYQLWLEKLGVAVVVPNVRGSAGYGKTYVALDNGYKREDSVKDIGALLDWIGQNPALDADNVAVFGGSYGGYMVLASAVHYSDRLKAAVDIVGISNFVTFLTNTRDYRRDLRRVEYGDERIPEMRAFLEKISPNNNVDKIKVPMFVVQGQNDPRVPVTEAEQIVESLRDAGNPVWYMNALNEGHGYRKKENRDAFSEATALFFAEHLLQAPVPGWQADDAE